MQITIFGATGLVGQKLVKQALWLGHTVLAFGRNTDTVFIDEVPNLYVHKGYLTDIDAIKHALQNSDAVCSAIGGNTTEVDNTRSIGMKNIAKVMEQLGITKIAAVGGMGILQANEEKMVYETEEFPSQYIPVTLEHLKAWQILEATNVQYAFFCPPMIADAAFDEKYIMQEDFMLKGSMSINAGNLADAMIKHVMTPKYIRKRVAIVNA